MIGFVICLPSGPPLNNPFAITNEQDGYSGWRCTSHNLLSDPFRRQMTVIVEDTLVIKATSNPLLPFSFCMQINLHLQGRELKPTYLPSFLCPLILSIVEGSLVPRPHTPSPKELFRGLGMRLGGRGTCKVYHNMANDIFHWCFCRRSISKAAQQAKQLWKYLVHQDEVRETFIHYIFTNKVQVVAQRKET